MSAQIIAVGNETAVPLPPVSQSDAAPIKPLSTVKELLSTIDPTKKSPMLWTTAVHLAGFAGVDLERLAIETLMDVGPAFRLYLKDRRYSATTVRSYVHHAGNLLKRAEELGWVSGNQAIAVAWAPIVAAVKEVAKAPKAVARYAIGKGIHPKEFGETELNAWGVWAERCGRKHRTVRLLKSQFRRAVLLGNLEHLMPKLVCRREPPYRIRTADMPEPLRSQVQALIMWKLAKFAKDRPSKTRHRPVSAKQLEAWFCRLYGFAVNIAGHRGIASMWDLVNEEVVTDFIEWGVNERELSRATLLRLSMIYGALRHHREYRDHDLTWMSDLFSQLPEEDESKLVEKKAKKYVPYAELCRVPERIRQIRLRKGCDPLRASWSVHDELLTTWVTVLPWRQRNLRECRLGDPTTANLYLCELPNMVHVARPRWVEEALSKNPQQRFWQFFFREHETKTGHQVRGILPRRLIPLLEDYVKNHRPKLVGASDPSTLFLNRDGGPIDRQTMTELFGQLTLDHAGRRLTPHLCRDVFSYAFLEQFPEDFLSLSKILWHRSLKYTLRVYGRQFDESNGVRRVDEWLGAA